MRIMISYTREDVERVEKLVEGLRRLGHEPWYDRSLHSGESWWSVILRSIVESDAVLLAISPSFLQSHACTAERQFAVSVNRPLLAVKVTPVEHSVLPVELAGLHILDYTQPTEDSAFDLVRSIGALPPAPPPPRPLPPAPAVPLSYLNTMRDRISGPELDMNSQLSVVARLSDGMRSGDAEERQGARELLLVLSRRGQLYEQPAQLLRAALGNDQEGPPPDRPRPRAGGAPPYPAGPPPAWSPPAQPPNAGTSKPVKVLAWIGGIVVAFVLLGIALQSCGGGDPTAGSVCLVEPSTGYTIWYDSVTGNPELDADGYFIQC